MRGQDIVPATGGPEMEPGHRKGMNTETVPGGFIMPGEEKIEEAWVELCL